MPYPTLASLPDAVKKLPRHGQEIYQSAFNAAFKQYNDEGKAAGTAWAAVKMKYKQDAEGNWSAKETKEAIMPELSDENKRQLLQTALTAEFYPPTEDPIPHSIWIEDVFETELIYRVNDQTYKASFKMEEDGTVTFGEPEKVVKQTVYTPMESLRVQYQEILQEAGKRNAAMDAARVKKIVALCQELLSSEEPEEKQITKAAKEATSVLEWLEAQAIVKTEGKHQYPVEAYAYIGNKFKPESWQLRIWEDPDKGVTKGQLSKAAAALSPGGVGKIPAADLPGVKRLLRAAYRKLGVEAKDMPKWIQEAETREEVWSYVPLTEAKFDKGRATVVVIEPGFNASGDRYYPAEVLKRDYTIFEGQKMYADHPTEQEDKERPERSIRDWVATLSEVKCDENGVVTGVAEIIEPWMMQKLASLREKDMLSEMGISINAVGSASKGTIDGKETMVIEKLVAARSVDFVTEPGAGGIVKFYEADRSRDVDLIELSALRERRPDLVDLIEVAVRAEITKEVKKLMEGEARVAELEDLNTTLTAENTELKTAAETAVKEKARLEAQATIKEAVDKAELPTPAKARLIERFKDAETADGIDEAITSEVAYIATLAEAGKVKNLGGTKPNTDKDVEALRESIKLANPGWSDELVETAVTGR